MHRCGSKKLFCSAECAATAFVCFFFLSLRDFLTLQSRLLSSALRNLVHSRAAPLPYCRSETLLYFCVQFWPECLSALLQRRSIHRLQTMALLLCCTGYCGLCKSATFSRLDYGPDAALWKAIHRRSTKILFFFFFTFLFSTCRRSFSVWKCGLIERHCLHQSPI